MIQNETMQSILARRSYKMFDGKPIGDEELDTIVTAGLYAPTGMNRQPWHFTVIKSPEMLKKIGEARANLPMPSPPPGMPGMPSPPPGMPAGGMPPMGDPMRNAPVLILVSANNDGLSQIDCCLAMENMFIAAASLGIMSGWDHATVKDLFAEGRNPELRDELLPEGNTVFAAAFFGYPGPDVKDRGERRGTVAYK